MADDEGRAGDEGFTFVDKRRVNAEEKEQEPPVADTAQAVDALEDGQAAAAEDDIQSPGTWGLVNYVIGLLAFDSWQRLGLIADPSTGKVEKDLAQARLGIDCVASLISVVDSSDSELPETLRGELRRVLSDLRINYVEQSRRQES